MKIQSLSVVVPNKRCINACKFCVSRMRCEEYRNMMDENLPFYDLYERDYIKRLEFARDNGCNTVMLTGNSEPQQNRAFLQRFGTMNQNLARPFRWIEMQTTGVLLDEPYLRFLRNHVGVSTISVSTASFDDAENASICGMHADHTVRLQELCASIKKYDFNLRLSLNLTSAFAVYQDDLERFFLDIQGFGADQATFRVLYSDGGDSPQSRYVQEHALDGRFLENLRAYVHRAGKPLEVLEFGLTRYAVCGLSVVIDDDCMSTIPKNELKYLILRPNCKLYSKWDEPASLLF